MKWIIYEVTETEIDIFWSFSVSVAQKGGEQIFALIGIKGSTWMGALLPSMRISEELLW
jgi:hypothetical protein